MTHRYAVQNMNFLYPLLLAAWNARIPQRLSCNEARLRARTRRRTLACGVKRYPASENHHSRVNSRVFWRSYSPLQEKSAEKAGVGACVPVKSTRGWIEAGIEAG